MRDGLEIVIQHPRHKDEGGDSSRTTGMMALFGSVKDKCVLHLFEPNGDGILVRHPSHYDHKCFTRDQLLPFVAGLWSACKTDIARRVFWSHAKRFFFCQNTHDQFTRKRKTLIGDPLTPDHIGHLILCANLWPLYPFLLISYPWLILNIFWHTKIDSKHEQNQTIAMAWVAGLIGLWAKWHPNWKGSINNYWSGWRDQKEIADIIIRYIDHRLSQKKARW